MRKIGVYVATWWLFIVASLEVVALSLMIVLPNNPGYAKAAELKWVVSPFWGGTTLASMVYLARVMWGIAIKKKKMIQTQYEFIETIAIVWIFVLVIFETMAGRYHISKFADAAFWLVNWYAAYVVYKYNSPA
jgi:magnesium-transporting ATPase (P-type)